MIGRWWRVRRVGGRLALADRFVLVVAVEFLFELIVVGLYLGELSLKFFAIVFFLGLLRSLLCRINVFLRELNRFLRPLCSLFVVARFGVCRSKCAENVWRLEFRCFRRFGRKLQ